MKLEIDGLDKLKKIERNSKRINGTQQIPLREILTDKFLQKYSNFRNLNDMVDKSGYKLEEFGERKEIDRFISQNSKFSSWEEMLSEASSQWTLNQIMK